MINERDIPSVPMTGDPYAAFLTKNTERKEDEWKSILDAGLTPESSLQPKAQFLFDCMSSFYTSRAVSPEEMQERLSDEENIRHYILLSERRFFAHNDNKDTGGGLWTIEARESCTKRLVEEMQKRAGEMVIKNN